MGVVLVRVLLLQTFAGTKQLESRENDLVGSWQLAAACTANLLQASDRTLSWLTAGTLSDV